MVFSILLLAATAKLFDVEKFMQSLREWRLLTPSAVPAVALLAPSLEAWLALCWFTGHKRARVIVWTAGMLAFYTAAYAAEMGLRSEPPACACFGLWERHFADLASGRYVLIRNLFLLAIVAGSGLIALPPRVARKQ